MKIITTLALSYLKKNKKKNIYLIFSIAIATILLTTILILISSYQQYLANSIRLNGNWEIKLRNITYEEAQKIANYNNIKEMSIIQKIGVSEENFGEIFKVQLDVRALDKKALKNSNIKIVEGRLPESSNELIISKGKKSVISQNDITNIKVGEKIKITLNGEVKDYFIVGKIESLEYDVTSFTNDQLGAITILDISKIDSKELVDVDILTKDIQKVYKTGNNIANVLGIKIDIEQETNLSENEMLGNILTGIKIGEKNSYVEYNTELLNYECVIDLDNAFARNLLIISVIVILILAIASHSIIKSAFKMIYWDRIREIGLLLSIGMNKKQLRKMIRIEIFVLTLIGIIIGIIIGLIFSYIIIQIMNSLIKLIDISQLLIINRTLDICMKMPVNILLLIIIIVLLIVRSASAIHIKEIIPIEAIKNSSKIKITETQVKNPRLIEILFKEEGMIAYKNIKRDKSKYQTVIFAIMISVILFLSINGLIQNIENVILGRKKREK